MSFTAQTLTAGSKAFLNKRQNKNTCLFVETDNKALVASEMHCGNLYASYGSPLG